MVGTSVLMEKVKETTRDGEHRARRVIRHSCWLLSRNDGSRLVEASSDERTKVKENPVLPRYFPKPPSPSSYPFLVVRHLVDRGESRGMIPEPTLHGCLTEVHVRYGAEPLDIP